MKHFILIILCVVYSFAANAENDWYYSGVEKEVVEAQLKLYPNPCKNSKLTVDFGSNEIKEIRLTNITGKQVLLKKYTIPTYKVRLQLNDIPNGIYLVQIKSGNNKMVVKKLMVSKN